MMSAGYSLRSRVPGQSVMSAVVANQKLEPTRSLAARILGVNPIAERNRLLFRAAVGELLVGDTLDQLGSEWDVLHAVLIDANNYEIDHLVIGPPGVFSVLTKNYPGDEISVAKGVLSVAGTATDDVEVALAEAAQVSELLSTAAGRYVEVRPLIAVVAPKRLLLRDQPEGIEIVSSTHLSRWFKTVPRELTGREVASISDTADRGETWESAPGIAQDVSELHREFARLRSDVAGARRVRVAWAALGFLVVVGLAWTAIAVLASVLMH